jgi:hypothetical protein
VPLPSLKVEVLLLNSIPSRVRSSGVLGLIAVEDKVHLTDAMDIMDLMGLTVMAEVATEDPHLRNTRDTITLHHLMLMSLLARPAPTLLQKANHPIIHAPSLLSLTIIRDLVLLMEDPVGILTTTEDAETVPAADITTTIDRVHLHSL